MHVMAFFSIHPIGKGEHVGDAIAKAVRVIRESGLEHELGPSGTTIVGPWDDVMACIKRAHAAVATGAARVSSVIKIDLKTDGFPPGAMRAKVQRVEDALAGTPRGPLRETGPWRRSRAARLRPVPAEGEKR